MLCRKERLAGIFTAIPDLEITIDEIIVEGNTTVSRFTYTGTCTGQLPRPPIPPAHRKAMGTGCAVSHGDGEKAVEIWEYADNPGPVRKTLPLKRRTFTGDSVIADVSRASPTESEKELSRELDEVEEPKQRE
jgi:hypothetical protein